MQTERLNHQHTLTRVPDVYRDYSSNCEAAHDPLARRRAEQRHRDSAWWLLSNISLDGIKHAIEHINPGTTLDPEKLKELVEYVLHPTIVDLIYPHARIDTPLVRTYWMATKLREALESGNYGAGRKRSTLTGYTIRKLDVGSNPDTEGYKFSNFRRIWCALNVAEDKSADKPLLEATRYTHPRDGLVQLSVLVSYVNMLDRADFISIQSDRPDAPPIVHAIREWEALVPLVQEKKSQKGVLVSEYEENNGGDTDLFTPKGHVMLHGRELQTFINAQDSLPLMEQFNPSHWRRDHYESLPSDTFADFDPKITLSQFDPTEYLPESIHRLREAHGWSVRHIEMLSEQYGPKIHASRLSGMRAPGNTQINLKEAVTLSEVFRIPLSEWLFAITMDFDSKRPRQ